MILLHIDVLSDFSNKHSDARAAIENFEEKLKTTDWKMSLDVKNTYPKVDLINGHYVFNIGKSYRLDTKITFDPVIVNIKRIGPHDEYDKWNFD